MLDKSGDKKFCGNCRTIAHISHAKKVIIIIILKTKKNVEFELKKDDPHDSLTFNVSPRALIWIKTLPLPNGKSC